MNKGILIIMAMFVACIFAVIFFPLVFNVGNQKNNIANTPIFDSKFKQASDLFEREEFSGAVALLEEIRRLPQSSGSSSNIFLMLTMAQMFSGERGSTGMYLRSLLQNEQIDSSARKEAVLLMAEFPYYIFDVPYSYPKTAAALAFSNGVTRPEQTIEDARLELYQYASDSTQNVLSEISIADLLLYKAVQAINSQGDSNGEIFRVEPAEISRRLLLSETLLDREKEISGPKWFEWEVRFLQGLVVKNLPKVGGAPTDYQSYFHKAAELAAIPSASGPSPKFVASAMYRRALYWAIHEGDNRKDDISALLGVIADAGTLTSGKNNPTRVFIKEKLANEKANVLRLTALNQDFAKLVASIAGD